MSIWRLVRLNFGRSPVHFGEVGIGIEETSERVRSDTLFSALVNAYARLFGSDAVKDFLAKAESSIRISSTFIYSLKTFQFDSLSTVFIRWILLYKIDIIAISLLFRELSIVYYLPRPLEFPVNYPDVDLGFYKAYKKIQYLPLTTWQRWYQTEGFSQADETELTQRTTTKDTNGNLTAEKVFDYIKNYAINTQPKVSIDRHTASTNFYHTGFTQFNYEQTKDFIEKRSGLYFLIYFLKEDIEFEQRLYAALNLLGENGLGGERSSGAGRFNIEYWGNLPTETWKNVVEFDSTENYCLLSLFWQHALEYNFLNNSSYELIERGGWIGSPFSGRQLRRKKVYMFAEGSVFTKQPCGQLANVTPNEFINSNGEYKPHPIYRSGISLSLPIKVKVENQE